MPKKTNEQAKVGFITGASRRVGAEIARVLHAKGMNVILHYHTSKKEAKSLCTALNKQRPDSARVLAADLSIFANLNALVQQAVEMWGQLDALVNNASIFYKTEIGEISHSTWDSFIDINLKAPFFLAQAAFPHLARQKGCIVNMIDIHAKRPMSGHPVYCISKAGLYMLTQTLAREFSPVVRVNAVSPGQVMWPEGNEILSESLKQKIMDRIPLQRQGTSEEIAKAVWFLIADATYMTGQDLAVDGGRLLFG
jgi:pteridine reductase